MQLGYVIFESIILKDYKFFLVSGGILRQYWTGGVHFLVAWDDVFDEKRWATTHGRTE